MVVVLLWVREILGWLLIGLSIFGFLIALQFLVSNKPIEGGITAFVSVAVFRGGISLIKIATAARAIQGVAAQTARPAAR